MIRKRNGQGTAQSTPWAPPPAYDKENAENTEGKVVGYDGPQRPGVLPEVGKERRVGDLLHGM